MISQKKKLLPLLNPYFIYKKKGEDDLNNHLFLLFFNSEAIIAIAKTEIIPPNPGDLAVGAAVVVTVTSGLTVCMGTGLCDTGISVATEVIVGDGVVPVVP